MRIEIITVGDEVLRAETRKDNARFLSGMLTGIGMEPSRITAIPDDLEIIAVEIETALARSEVVIVTGGLGPTVDDKTRQAAILALGGEAERREDLVEGIAARFRKFGREMPEGYRDLANIPAKAEILPNRVGAAFGLAVEGGGGRLFLLPGVPAEMETIFTESILPRLEGAGGRVRETLRIYGMMETGAEEIVRGVLDADRMDDVSIIAGPAGIAIHIWKDLVSVDEMNRLRELFGSYIYTSGDLTMEQVVVESLLSTGRSIATAESLTGGLLASAIVSVPGASESFMEGFITYSNEAKAERLGVDMDLIRRVGAVSREVCVAMADGARRSAGVDLALSTTGIAGPGGGSAEKPVGLVYTGLSTPEGTFCRKMRLPGERQQVRLRTVYQTLDLLRLFLGKEYERLGSLRV
ncbi:MAG: nicotinamide-nucleotide amidohydrolase family protein [Candidatus Krumholzibacteria bacterium]|nr:nicotinamide-nucleotide amidohydrolase family protein [Candidatus Krumholzibacteria bacterium]